MAAQLTGSAVRVHEESVCEMSPTSGVPRDVFRAVHTRGGAARRARVDEPVRLCRSVDGRPTIEFTVEDGAEEFRVVGPGAPIQIVRPDLDPDVVDHTDLGVHVDRRTGTVLEVIDRNAVATGLIQRSPSGANRQGGRLAGYVPKTWTAQLPETGGSRRRSCHGG